ncbi:MAG: UDP-N-acetylglucosamine--N-acetylmuramyl-(pentapeptide) pyrophosphoryl-undecaprenol N-acetylglucosamine transferase, partial [Gammaproteobacteria bacterium]|nr:UDP-N-acetylglucosamine--N-acetylmuramyl-(pentapeptide) pyrophosphoryl-undecaprenol N-acetylglucosamine transferase [Gammaproteobacteria bacterium]
PEPAQRQAGRSGPARLLVVGGSQGARALNQQVPAAVAQLPRELRPPIRHQAGRTLELARRAYAAHGVAAEIVAFIDDMPAAYAWADLVICRAGASTVAELAASGSAAILVPYPHAVDDHQRVNANYLAERGAARLIDEDELTPQRLAAELARLLGDRPQLLAMAQRGRQAAWPDAAGAIARACLQHARLAR